MITGIVVVGRTVNIAAIVVGILTGVIVDVIIIPDRFDIFS